MPDDLEPTSPWETLRRFTNARIGLGRVGDSLPTGAQLAFQRDHASARDAVHLPFDVAGVQAAAEQSGFTPLVLHSAAENRAIYLRRPDLGRRLSAESRELLERHTAGHPHGYDAAFVLTDGLSALAVHRHGLAVVARIAGLLTDVGWQLAPLLIAEQARVALGDEIGGLLGAEQVVMLIGERPGLSVADSLGIYLTYAPRPGRSDAERNCISNIHAQGLSYEQACDTLLYLMHQARRRKLTGVAPHRLSLFESRWTECCSSV